jgi:hypothetical protein
VEFVLRNTGSQEVSIYPRNFGGLPLEYIPAFENDQRRLLLFPTSPKHVHIEGGELPTERTDDCWRVPEEVFIAVESTAFEAVVRAGESYSVRHHLYHHRPENGCFSPGTYSVTKEFTLGGTSESVPSFRLSYNLTVAQSGELSLAVKGPSTI